MAEFRALPLVSHSVNATAGNISPGPRLLAHFVMSSHSEHVAPGCDNPLLLTTAGFVLPHSARILLPL